MTKLKNSLGFSAVEALLILVVVGILGFTGWFVYHSQKIATKDYSSQSNTQTSTTKKVAKPVDLYASWKTYSSAKEGLSFKYPSDWIATADPCVNPSNETDGECIKIDSPKRTDSDSIFDVTYYWNDGTNTGKSQVFESTSLAVKGTSTPLYVAAESEGDAAGLVCGLSLVSQNYAVGQDASVASQVASQKQKNIVYALEASMIPAGGSQNAPCQTLAAYKAQPDYQSLLKLFQSIQYN